MINPAFLNRQEEAALLGAMVIGYGELDLSFASIAGIAINHQFAVLEACHKIRTERGRLDIAVALSHQAFQQAGLQSEFEYTAKALGRCLRIRNNYAHAQWADLNEKGLCLMNPETAFERPQRETEWTPVPLPLLKEQEAFFQNTRKWIIYLELQLRVQQDGEQIDLAAPRKMPLPKPHGTQQKSGRTRSK